MAENDGCSNRPRDTTTKSRVVQRRKGKRGPKPADDPLLLRNIIVENKDRIVCNGKILPKSNGVWVNLKAEYRLNSQPQNLYTYVVCNRGPEGGVLVALGLKEPEPISIAFTQLHDREQSSSSTESILSTATVDSNPPTFKIFVSAEKWRNIIPKETVYRRTDASRRTAERTYDVLEPGEWTRTLANLIHEETRLPCSWSFKRHYVARSSEAQFLVSANATCKCGGTLFVSCPNSETSDPYEEGLHLDVVISNADEGPHNDIRKRPLKGQERIEVGTRMVKEGLSATYMRKRKAGDVMNMFEVEPGIVPNLETYRKAKSEQLSKEKLSEDPVVALSILKNTSPFHLSIFDLGYDPFFIHYFVPEQLTLYNTYQKKVYSRVIIDASGKIVPQLKRKPTGMSGNLFMYEAVISIPGEHEGQVPVTHMISERHNVNAIVFWLSEWVRLGALPPNEIVIDFSSAILLSICKVFGKVNTTAQYIDMCFNFLRSPDVNPCPHVLIRIDVAHLICMLTKWKSIKAMRKRAKEFYIRSIYLIILSEGFEEAANIVRSIFIVSSNETEGVSESTGENTPCETHKKALLEQIGKERARMGYVDRLMEENDLGEAENSPVDLEAGIAAQEHARDWVNRLFLECTGDENIVRDGDRDNMMYSVAFRDAFLDLVYKLPLWSNSLARAMNSPYHKAIGAHVESNYNELKNRLIPKKLRVDLYVKEHLEIVTSSMILASGLRFFHQSNECVMCLIGDLPDPEVGATCSLCSKRVHEHKSCSLLRAGCTRVCLECSLLPSATEDPVTECSYTARGILFTENQENDSPDSPAPVLTTVSPTRLSGSPCSSFFGGNVPTLSTDGVETAAVSSVSRCVACSMGNPPDPSGSHKCEKCGKPVHALPGCSIPAPESVEGYGQGRICMQCSGDTGNVRQTESPVLEIRSIPRRGRRGRGISSTNQDGTRKQGKSHRKPSKVPDQVQVHDAGSKILNVQVPQSKKILHAELQKKDGVKAAAVSSVSRCVACSMGNPPDPAGSHKCEKCDKPVHALPGCSIPAPESVEGYGQGRVCMQCSGDTGNVQQTDSPVLGMRTISRRGRRGRAISSSVQDGTGKQGRSLRKSSKVADQVQLDDGGLKILNVQVPQSKKTVRPELQKKDGVRAAAVSSVSRCVACSMGNPPDPAGSHKCEKCDRPVHALPGCSTPAPESVEGYGQGRMCMQCSGDTGNVQQTESPVLGIHSTSHRGRRGRGIASSTQVGTGKQGKGFQPKKGRNSNQGQIGDAFLGSTAVQKSQISTPMVHNKQHSKGSEALYEEREMSVGGSGIYIQCSECSVGHLPDTSGHKCIICNQPVHALPGCSESAQGCKEGFGQGRICLACKSQYKVPDALTQPFNQSKDQATGRPQSQGCCLCASGSMPSTETKCTRCRANVHCNDGCSVPDRGDDPSLSRRLRICCTCASDISTDNQQLNLFENWKNLGLPPQKKIPGYYGKPYPELSLRLQNEFKSVNLKPLKNGGLVSSKARKCQNRTVSLNNTCAVDALIHVFATAYCDSPSFREYADKLQDPLLQLSVFITKEGVKAKAYQMRSELLLERLESVSKQMKYDILHINCAQTPTDLATSLQLPPSVVDNRECSSQYCPYAAQDLCGYIPCLSARAEILLSNGIRALQPAVLQNQPPPVSMCLKPFSQSQLSGVPRESEYVENDPPDPKYSKYVLCGGTVTHTQRFQHHILVSIAGNQRTVLSESDVGSIEAPLQCRLNEVPVNMVIRESCYTLRGVIAFNPPGVQKGTSKFEGAGLGHYFAYCRRIGGHWSLFDDLKEKQCPVKEDTKAFVEMLLYTKTD